MPRNSTSYWQRCWSCSKWRYNDLPVVIPRKFFIRRHISPDLGDATTIQFQDISFYVIVYGYLIPLNFRSTTIQLHVSTIDSLPRYILTVTDTKVLVNDPRSILFHHDYPTRALVTRLEVRTMRTPRSASIHKLRLQ